jgi:hypothetical protein
MYLADPFLDFYKNEKLPPYIPPAEGEYDEYKEFCKVFYKNREQVIRGSRFSKQYSLEEIQEYCRGLYTEKEVRDFWKK